VVGEELVDAAGGVGSPEAGVEAHESWARGSEVGAWGEGLLERGEDVVGMFFPEKPAQVDEGVGGGTANAFSFE
jgi:hypothetical protein